MTRIKKGRMDRRTERWKSETHNAAYYDDRITNSMRYTTGARTMQYF